MPRGPRIVVAAATLLIAVSSAGLAAASLAKTLPPPVCGPLFARTLAADHQARVFVRGDTVYGCAAGTTSTITLGSNGSCLSGTRVSPVVLAGQLAAYGAQTCGIDTGSTSVIVRRLTDGQIQSSHPSTGPVGPESYQWVRSLVLKPDGAVAWIGVGRSIGTRVGVTEVWRTDRRGTVRLDSGPAVRSSSLRLVHGGLRWLHGSQPRTASLI